MDFVKLGKRLASRSVDARAACKTVVGVNADGERAYTNGHVIVSEAEVFGDAVRLIEVATGKDVTTLHSLSLFPRVDLVLSRIDKSVQAVELPADFYDRLREFKVRKRMHVRVRFSADSVKLYGYHRSVYTPPHTYTGLDLPQFAKGYAELEALYLWILRPRQLRVPTDLRMPWRLDGCKFTDAPVVAMAALNVEA